MTRIDDIPDSGENVNKDKVLYKTKADMKLKRFYFSSITFFKLLYEIFKVSNKVLLTMICYTSF